ncbi:hypothetical protein WY02_23510 [Pseudonocardia sp. AL041005-10]|nr:hypothetical protein WY02_23510 [Pseudonocardia sp. AL041005-10]
MCAKAGGPGVVEDDLLPLDRRPGRGDVTHRVAVERVVPHRETTQRGEHDLAVLGRRRARVLPQVADDAVDARDPHVPDAQLPHRGEQVAFPHLPVGGLRAHCPVRLVELAEPELGHGTHPRVGRDLRSRNASRRLLVAAVRDAPVSACASTCSRRER